MRNRTRSASGNWYSGAARDRQAHAGAGGLRFLAPERQAKDIDDVRVAGRSDVAVRRHGEAEVSPPATALPDLVQETADVRDGDGMEPACQDALEMLARQLVLAPEEERPGEFQADANEVRLLDQDGAERGNGLVEQRLPIRGAFPFLGRAHRRQAGQEKDIDPVRIAQLDPAQDFQRGIEPVVQDQQPRVHDIGIIGKVRQVLRLGHRDRRDQEDSQRCEQCAETHLHEQRDPQDCDSITRRGQPRMRCPLPGHARPDDPCPAGRRVKNGNSRPYSSGSSL